MRKVGLILCFLMLMLFMSLQKQTASQIDYETLFENTNDTMTSMVHHANHATVDTNTGMHGMASDMIEAARNSLGFVHGLAANETRTTYVYAYPIMMAGEPFLFSTVIAQTETVYNRNVVIALMSALALVAIIAIGLFINLRIRHERQKRLQAKEVYLKGLLDYIVTNSTLGIAVHDRDLRYVFVSEKYFEQYKLEDQDIIGKHHYDVFPDLPQKWRDIHQRVLQGETHRADRDPFVREDGSVQMTRWLCRPWYGENDEIAGIILYTEVIDDLIAKEQEAQKAHERLRHIMDSLPIGIAVLTRHNGLGFEYMNDNFPSLYGVTRETLESADSFWETVFKDKHAYTHLRAQIRDDIASGDTKRMIWEDIPIKHADGSVRYISARCTPLPQTNALLTTVIDVTDRNTKEDAIHYASNHDYLTRLPNRRYYQTTLAKVEEASSYPLGIAIMDLNGLKLINDAFGHGVGNEALKEVGKVLRDARQDEDFVARIGGDEFALISPHTDATTMAKKADDLSTRIAKLSIQDVNLSLAIGVAVKANGNESIRDTLTEAENNMYKNKVLYRNSMHNDAIHSILQTLKNKFHEEKVHSERVSRYCRLLGEAMGMRENEVRELEMAGLYHDIGKISIPDAILDKPGPLNDEEWAIMRNHTLNGYQILRAADRYSNIAEYAMSHHERIDGKGYPNGLKGDAIPLFARIICVADAFEAMTSDRPYRKAINHHAAVEELKRYANTQFDAKIVNLFINEVLNMA